VGVSAARISLVSPGASRCSPPPSAPDARTATPPGGAQDARRPSEASRCELPHPNPTAAFGRAQLRVGPAVLMNSVNPAHATPFLAEALMMRWAQWVTRPSSLALTAPARGTSTLLWALPPPHRPLQPSNLCGWVSLRGLLYSAPAFGRGDTGERGRGRGGGGGGRVRDGGRGASAGRGRTPPAAPHSVVARGGGGGGDRFDASDAPRQGARRHGGCLSTMECTLEANLEGATGPCECVVLTIRNAEVEATPQQSGRVWSSRLKTLT
jgi:hypothetical protein